MFWVVIALTAHLMNALVFVVDKSLLSTKDSIVSQPARYAALSGLVAAGAVVVLPFGFALPNNFVVMWSLLAGVFWVAALWLFFIALKNGESSRVVPIAGSAVPLFTLIIATTLLGEVLTGQHLLAVTALIIGGMLLSIRLTKGGGVSKRVLGAATLSGAAFAAHFATVDYIYDRFEPFLAAFAYSRMGVGLAALVLLIFVLATYKKPRSSQKKAASKVKRAGMIIAVAFISSKLLGALALILQNYAISLGSVTIVNALQGTQYAFLLLLAIIISRKLPKLFTEELKRVVLTQKIAGIVVIAIGLVLLV